MKKHTTVSNMAAASFACFALMGAHSASAAPKVAVSITPIYSITTAIMKGAGTPQLIIDQSTSPHSTDLRPSDAKAIQDADLVVWIGHDLEIALDKPIDTLSDQSKVLTLSESEAIHWLPVREGGNWVKHEHDHGDHDEHEHDADHDEHNDADNDHDHDDHHAEAEHEHDHEEGENDPHMWLDPQNGIAMAKAIAAKLSEIDAENAALYQENEAALIASIKDATIEAQSMLKADADKPFIVFHDAYQYFEQAFGVSAIGSVRFQAEVAPGAAHVKEIREKLKSSNAACLMSEPQFSSKLLPVLIEGTSAKLGEMDPLGTNLKLGPDLYPELIKYNAKQLSECLG